jgi:hypothetical protein
VHLRGTVARVCLASPTKPNPSPPGFGVRLDQMSSPRDDAQRYLRTYDHLQDEERQHEAAMGDVEWRSSHGITSLRA